MDKILELLKRLGIELTGDQTAQLKEVAEKEFVPAADAAKNAAKVEELTKQLAERDSNLEKGCAQQISGLSEHTVKQ